MVQFRLLARTVSFGRNSPISTALAPLNSLRPPTSKFVTYTTSSTFLRHLSKPFAPRMTVAIPVSMAVTPLQTTPLFRRKAVSIKSRSPSPMCPVMILTSPLEVKMLSSQILPLSTTTILHSFSAMEAGTSPIFALLALVAFSQATSITNPIVCMLRVCPTANCLAVRTYLLPPSNKSAE